MGEHGLRLYTTHRNFSVWCSSHEVAGHDESPWMFAMAKRIGFITAFGEEFCWEGSPWVVQNNIFHLEADFMLHRAHCRLAERYLMRRKIRAFGPRHYDTDAKLYLYASLDDSRKLCIGGKTGPAKARILLDPTRQLWDVYRDQPKFAFLNVMAAHVYSKSGEETIRAAEAFDDSLHQFLSEFFAREDTGETIVVVRADHGLQDGPMFSEYSAQVEASRPFMEVIVPERLRGLSLEALWRNQDRLVSGYDLYKTLATAMVADGTDTGAPLPSWAVDLFAEEVPTQRSCWEARIPAASCRRDSLTLGLESHRV